MTADTRGEDALEAAAREIAKWMTEDSIARSNRVDNYCITSLVAIMRRHGLRGPEDTSTQHAFSEGFGSRYNLLCIYCGCNSLSQEAKGPCRARAHTEPETADD
jgi:hypothetical protein